MFDKASTLTRQDNSNRIVGILQALGETDIPEYISKVDLAKRLVAALQQNPLCRVESEWAGQGWGTEGSSGRSLSAA